MTTHAQHTPGPWNLPGHTLLNDESSDIPIYAKTRTGTRLVAGVSKCYDGAEWANARLIAAAPALLEALEAAEERIAELETWLVSETGQHSATYRKVRTAIAQAKGESNG